MNFPEIKFPIEKALKLSQFRDMDYYAVENFNIPIELMMENAGLQLAKLVVESVNKNHIIKIGIGNGNNGGGGLVAARRLLAWGYNVYLDIFTEITKELPKAQLQRAISFGAKLDSIDNADVWVDAYLGFSQRLPLHDDLLQIIEKANKSDALLICLDIPTGFVGDLKTPRFDASKILTLAAPKTILYKLQSSEIYVADLGIPKQVYEKFDTEILPFDESGIIKLI